MSVDAVLLTSFGGPEGPDEVMPFLERVTAGRGVPRERLEEVAHHYLELGGVSPINAQNRALIDALRAELAGRGIDVPVYFGNRNSEPYFAGTLRAIADDGHRDVLALVTSAYSSYSGCRQYRENLAGALEEAGLAGSVRVTKSRHYYADAGFLEPFARSIRTALEELAGEGHRTEATHVHFTTHSIPEAMDASSGPPAHRLASGEPGLYSRQHLQAAERIMAMVAADGGPAPSWSLVFQSRSGPPSIPWLEPDIGDALREQASAGGSAAVVAPIGFISDHVEVVWDLDHEAAEIARDLGLAFRRVPTPGTDPAFVAALADVVAEAIDGSPLDGEAAGVPWRELCGEGCCPNARRELPTVPGSGSRW